MSEVEAAARVSGPSAVDARLRSVTEYIDRCVAAGEGVLLAELAEVAGMSPHHFAHVFRRAKGFSPHRYVIERRVARAAELLRDPSLSICQVANRVGFSSQSHLTFVFRRFHRITPGAYRRRFLQTSEGKSMERRR